MGMLVVFGPVQPVYASPHLTSVAPGEDKICGILVVYIPLPILKSRVLFQTEGLICLGAKRSCWGAFRSEAEKPDSVQQVVSLRTTTWASKELSEPGTETENCTSLVQRIHGLVSKSYCHMALNPVLLISYRRSHVVL